MTSRIRRTLLLAIFASGALALANSRVRAVQAEMACLTPPYCDSAADCQGDFECGCYTEALLSGSVCKR